MMKILPAKRQNRTPLLLRARVNHSPWSMRARIVTGAVAVLAFAALPAGAVDRPQVTSLYPAPGTNVRSAFAQELVATFDRGLAEGGLDFTLTDGGNNAISGIFFLSGPVDPGGHERAVTFRPGITLPQAGSPFTAVARVCPVAGECTTETWSFGVDDTEPSPATITSPAPGSVDRNQPVLLKGDAEAGARIVVTENGDALTQGPVSDLGKFSIPLPYGPEDGAAHTIRLRVVDQAGNAAPEQGLSFVHDSVVVRPVISIPDEGQALNTTSIRIGGAAKANSTIELRESSILIGTATTDSHGFWEGTFTFAAGSHTVSATSFDGYTIDGPSNARTFIVDMTAPAAPVVIQPGAGTAVGDTVVTIAGTAEPNAAVRIRENSVLRGTAQVDGSGTWSTDVSFVDGAHTITAETVDPAGNISSAATHTFTVDTVAPPTPVVSTPENGGFVSSQTVTVSGTAEPGVAVELRESSLIGSGVAAGSGAWSVIVTLGEGEHGLTATAVDAAGNPSVPAAPVRFTVDTLAPPAPSFISPPQGSSLTSREIFISGTAEPRSAVTVTEGLDQIAFVPADGEGNWGSLVRLTNGPHTITATAADRAGNAGPSSPARSFTVGAAADTTPPPPPLISSPVAGSLQPMFVTFKGSAEPLTTVRVYEGAAILASGSADSGGSWSVGEYVTQSGFHTIHATATDGAGNVSSASTSRTFRVDANRPVVQIETLDPAIAIIGALDPSVAGLATDDNSVTTIEYEVEDRISGNVVTLGQAQECTPCPGGATVQWLIRPTLGPGLFTVRVWAVDLVGNRSAPGTLTMLVV